MCHTGAQSASHMPRLYGNSDKDEHRWTQARLKVTFRYRPVAGLIDYCHNEVLSLSAFVGRSDQSLDIVSLTIKAEDQIDDTI